MTEKAKARTAASVKAFTDLPDEAFVRCAVVCGLLDFSRATLGRKLHARQIPQPIVMGPNVHRWRVGDLRTYLANPAGFKVAPL
jgi:predicted DNA-binding transcriptional regulator AlpA